MTALQYPEDYIQPASDWAVLNGFFPEGPPSTNDTPINAAFLWWVAVLNRDRQAYEALSYNPADWQGYNGVRADLEAHALCAYTELCPDDDSIAYAKLMPDPGYGGIVIRPFTLSEGRWLALVTDGAGWFVWGISPVSFKPDSRFVRFGN